MAIPDTREGGKVPRSGYPGYLFCAGPLLVEGIRDTLRHIASRR